MIPIVSMGLVYLPTFGLNLWFSCREIYPSSHGSYWVMKKSRCFFSLGWIHQKSVETEFNGLTHKSPGNSFGHKSELNVYSLSFFYHPFTFVLAFEFQKCQTNKGWKWCFILVSLYPFLVIHVLFFLACHNSMYYQYQVVLSNILSFHPYLGEDFQFEHMFQLGGSTMN